MTEEESDRESQIPQSGEEIYLAKGIFSPSAKVGEIAKVFTSAEPDWHAIMAIYVKRRLHENDTDESHYPGIFFELHIEQVIQSLKDSGEDLRFAEPQSTHVYSFAFTP